MRKTPNDMVTGTHHMSDQYGYLEIVDYNNASNVIVKFLATGYETIAQASKIRRGRVKDRFAPSVYGVGYVGDGEFKPSIGGKLTKIYKTWQAMLSRCYDPKYQATYPTCVGCSVVPEWHNFQTFAEWMSRQDYEGKHLDKDIKSKGNKVYSPETCMFVTQVENVVDARAKHYTFVSPDGEKVEIYNLNEFCRENNLHQSAMSRVHLGKVNHHKGWRKACTCNNT